MAPKDVKAGVDARTAADKALAEGDFDEALTQAKVALELLEDSGEEEVNALCTLAAAYLVNGKNKLALEKAKAAKSLSDNVGGASKGTAMMSLVKTYLGYKVVPAAILSASAAMMPLKSQAGDAVMQAVKAVPTIDFMSPSVDTSVMSDAMEDATTCAEDALAFFKAAGDKKGEATASYLSTYLKSEKRILRDALPALEEVQALYKAAGTTKEEELVIKDILSYHLGKADADAASKLKGTVAASGAASLLRVVADTYFTMKEADQAQTMVMEALATFRGAGDKAGEVAGLRAMMNLHLAKGEVDDALQLADQIASKCDGAAQAAAYYMLASIQLMKEGGAGEAAGALSKASEMFRAAGDNSSGAEALIACAEVQLANGDADPALSTAQGAVQIAEGHSLKALHAKALRTKVSASMAKEDDAAAMKDALEAQKVSKDGADKKGEIAALRSIAEIHLQRGSSTAAIETATEMLTLCADCGHTAGEAAAKLILANAILSTDQASQEGLQCGKEALALFDQVGDVFGTATTLYMLANGFFARAELEEGLKCAREALAIFRQTGDTMNEEILKQTIEQARAMTAEYRKQAPKKPMLLPAGSGPPPSTGPEVSPITDSRVPKEALESAVASRKYWGIPKMVQPDPTVDAIERAPSHAIIWGHSLSDNVATQNCVEFGDLVATMAKGDVAKIPIVVTTQGVNGRMTGEHIPHHMTGVSAVTIWGMVRTVRQEIPQVQCLLLDFSAQQTSAQIPRNLRMPPLVAESAYYHHARWEPQLAQVPSLFRRELKRDNLTGGGGGGGNMGDPKKAAKFMRRSFNWTGPSHKLDFAWYRQEWRAVGPAEGNMGPMPPQQPCKAMRNV